MAQNEPLVVDPATSAFVVARIDNIVAIDTAHGRYIFQPELAVAVANAMLHAAQEAGADVHVEVDKKAISETTRLRLINRVFIMMKTQRRDLPRQIVDTILSEVL